MTSVLSTQTIGFNSPLHPQRAAAVATPSPPVATVDDRSVLHVLRDVKFPFVLQSSRATYIAYEHLASGNGGYIFRIDVCFVAKLVPFMELSGDETFILTQVHNPHLLHAIDHGIVKLSTAPSSTAPSSPYFYFFILPCMSATLQYLPMHTVSFAQRIQWIRQLYCGLRALHLHKHVHGDIHPKNVLLSPRNEMVWCDFNLSYGYDEPLTQTYQISTPPYCSPLSLLNNGYITDVDEQRLLLTHIGEKVEDRKHEKCDIFAFGQLCTYLLTSSTCNNTSFLCGKNLVDVRGYIANTFAFAKEGDQYLVTYISKCFELLHLHAQIQQYLTCFPSSTLCVSSLFSLLRDSLRLRQADRASLLQFEFVLGW